MIIELFCNILLNKFIYATLRINMMAISIKMRDFKNCVWALMVILAMMFSPMALAASVDAIQSLDEVSLVAVGEEVEIHVNFAIDVNYLKHFPETSGDVLRISVNIKDPCDAAGVVMSERKQGYTNKALPGFDITFPETPGGTGIATCARDGIKNVETAKTLLLKFDQPTSFKVRMGDNARSIVIVVPVLAKFESAAVMPIPAIPGLPENATAVELQTAARAALVAGSSAKAIDILNRQLNLPPNDYTQEAQELIGRAREMSGQFEMAASEYKLYLKLYPAGDGAKRVQDRLEALKKAISANATKKLLDKKTAAKFEKLSKPETTVTGGISQYYYGGKSWTNNHDGAGDRYNLDQSSLMTSLDVTGRFRRSATDSKIVFRDQDTHNFPPGVRFVDRNSVSAAYFEQNNKELGYFVRLGRQPGTAEGVLGRFDGASARYALNSEWKVFGVLGQPDNGTHNKVTTNRTFFGGAIEFTPKESHISGNVYFNQQNADGLVERRAIGTELRYFNNTFSSFGLLEYDTLYSVINMAMLQANYLTSNGINLNMFLDHRSSPLMTADVVYPVGSSIATLAVPPLPNPMRVSDLRALLTSGQIYSYAPNLAPKTDSGVLSAFKQLSPRWQVGGDVRANHTSSTQGLPDFGIPAQPASGMSYGMDMNLVGSSLIFSSDTNVMNGGLSFDPHSTSQSLSFSNIAMFRTFWKSVTSLQLSHSQTDSGGRSYRVSPQLTLGYSPRPNMNIEAQFGVEQSYRYQDATDTITASQSDTFREFMFIGYRLDFM